MSATPLRLIVIALLITRYCRAIATNNGSTSLGNTVINPEPKPKPEPTRTVESRQREYNPQDPYYQANRPGPPFPGPPGPYPYPDPNGPQYPNEPYPNGPYPRPYPNQNPNGPQFPYPGSYPNQPELPQPGQYPYPPFPQSPVEALGSIRDSFVQALESVAFNDELRCVPKLLCELASGNGASLTQLRQLTGGRQSLLPFNLDMSSLLGMLSQANLDQASPLLMFGRAALLGYTSQRDPNACYYAYPRCPRDPDRLVQYLNNYNGGFFRYFNGLNQNPENQNQNPENYPNQYQNPQNYPNQYQNPGNQYQNPGNYPNQYQNPQNYPNQYQNPGNQYQNPGNYPNQYQNPGNLQYPNPANHQNGQQYLDRFNPNKGYGQYNNNNRLHYNQNNRATYAKQYNAFSSAQQRILTQPNIGVPSFKSIKFPENNEDYRQHYHLNSVARPPLVFPENGYTDYRYRKEKRLLPEPVRFERPLPNHVASPMIFPTRTGTGELILDSNLFFPNEYRDYYAPVNNYNPNINNNLY